MTKSRLTPTIDLAAEGKHTGYLRLPHSVHRSAYGWLPVPITSIRNGAGPRVILLAGVHGDEWDGQLALMNLVRTLQPSQIRGHVIIMSAANFPAVMGNSRTSPIDDVNMNRCFPGDANGTITQQIAHFIEEELMPGSDLLMDLHSGGSSLMYIPSSLSRELADPQQQARSIALHRAFGAPVAYISNMPQGEDRTVSAGAGRKNVLYIGTELGGGGTLSRHTIEVAEGGVRRSLGWIGLLPEAKDDIAPPTRLVTVGGLDYYVYAPDGGIFEPKVDLGDEVRKGQTAALVHFPDTPSREPTPIAFERDGFVLCKRVPSRCERGDCLYHLATDRVG